MKQAVGAPANGLLVWTGAHLLAFFKLVGRIFFFGLIAAIVRRQFCWKAFFLAVIPLTCGFLVLAAILLLKPAILAPHKENILWGLYLLGLFSAGWVAGKRSATTATWEIYALVLLSALVAWLYLSGWTGRFALTHSGGTDIWNQNIPGLELLGVMWDRLLVLATVAGYLLALLAGSLAFILYGSTGRFQPHIFVEWFIGQRYLFKTREGLVSTTAIVAIVGVAVGVGALVTVTAAMSGYQNDVQQKILSTNAHLVVQKYGVDFAEYEQVMQSGLSVGGVVAASPFVFNEALLSAGDNALGVLIKGIVVESASKVTAIADNICLEVTEAGFCKHSATHTTSPILNVLHSINSPVPQILIGLELYKKLGVNQGDTVVMTTPLGIASGKGSAPKRMSAAVGGVFHSGMHEFDSRLVYMDMAAAQTLLGMGNTVSGVEFRLTQPERVEHTARQVLRAVGMYPFRTLTWKELNQGIFTALKLQKIVMFLVLTFIVIVAAFNIASTLFMAVIEKTRDIAVLKSMGARDNSIMKIFVLEGWIVGGAGVLLGVALGLLACWLLAHLHIHIAADVYMVEQLAIRIQPGELLLIACSALVISHLATLFPALNAASQHPVDAMRYA